MSFTWRENPEWREGSDRPRYIPVIIQQPEIRSVDQPVLEDGKPWWPMFTDCPHCEGTDIRPLTPPDPELWDEDKGRWIVEPDRDTVCTDCGFTWPEEKPDIVWDDEKMRRTLTRSHHSPSALWWIIDWWSAQDDDPRSPRSLDRLSRCHSPIECHRLIDQLVAQVAAGEMAPRVANRIIREIKLRLADVLLFHTRSLTRRPPETR